MLKHKPFLITSFLILLMIFILEKINHRFWLHDFNVYYGALGAFINHKAVYFSPFGLATGVYKYSPFVLFLMMPFSWFGYETASVVQFWILALSFMGTFLVSAHLLNTYSESQPPTAVHRWLIFGFLLTLVHTFRELHLGNINILLLLLLCGSAYWHLEKKDSLAGLALAVVVSFKPFFGLLLLGLLIRRQWRMIGYFAGFSAGFILAPFLVCGFDTGWQLHRDWLQTLLAHGSSFPSVNTTDALIRHYLWDGFQRAYQFPFMGVCLLIYGAWVMQNMRSTEAGQKHLFLKEWLVLIGLIPNFLPTDSQHFLLSIPLVLWVLASPPKSLLSMVIYSAILFCYGGNIVELLGRDFSQWLEHSGLLGLGNLGLVAWCLGPAESAVTAKRAVLPA